jgi:hypothetical protein
MINIFRKLKTKDIEITEKNTGMYNTQQDLNGYFHQQIDDLQVRLFQTENELKKTSQVLGSLLKYLDLRVKRENIPDPSKLPPEPEMISVLNVYKNKKK